MACRQTRSSTHDGNVDTCRRGTSRFLPRTSAVTGKPNVDPSIGAAQARESVREAALTKTAPERLTPLVEPPPFDRGAFEADPQRYLNTVEPGRCFQTKRAEGPDDVHLALVSNPRAEINMGEKTALSVKSAPSAPVTFTSFNGGVFDGSGLGSVSVRADARGYATVHYSAGPGTTGDIQIQAGSPMAVGSQLFLVRVRGR